jgi:hypothetical protein
MSFVSDFIGDVVGGITGAKQAGKAAQAGAETQAAATQAGIEEQRRQFDKLVEIMSPYVAPGEKSIEAQQALLGLLGTEEQQKAIAGIEAGPTFGALARQGEEAILQKASATGGLRGGNVQAALAQFRPQLLQSLIEQQYTNLGGLTKIGQASAAGQAAAGMESATSISNLLGQQGAQRAGGQIAMGNVNRQAFGDLLKIGSAVAAF